MSIFEKKLGRDPAQRNDGGEAEKAYSFGIKTSDLLHEDGIADLQLPPCTITLNKGMPTQRSFPCEQAESTLRSLSPNSAPASIEVVVAGTKKGFFGQDIKTKTVTASLGNLSGDSENSIDAVAKIIACCSSRTTIGGFRCMRKI
jgi:hypothetical protein